MAEKHDYLVSQYKVYLVKKKYTITKKSPFVDYRPDICALKNKEKIFVEVEIDSTLQTDHTLEQLDIMYDYLVKDKKYTGVLVVPIKSKHKADLLIKSVFGDNKIKVVGL